MWVDTLRSRIIELSHDHRGFAETIGGMFGVSILLLWGLLLMSLMYFTQGAITGSLTAQGLAQMVPLLPAPQNTTQAMNALNSAIGTFTKTASPKMVCRVTRYLFTPANSFDANAFVTITMQCKVAALSFGDPTISYHQQIAVFYAHVIN
jgi:hypothetical protein